VTAPNGARFVDLLAFAWTSLSGHRHSGHQHRAGWLQLNLLQLNLLQLNLLQLNKRRGPKVPS
jgi:hypothetical protein